MLDAAIDSTISFPAAALFLTAMGVAVTIITAVAVVVWRFSALASKMESITCKLEEIIIDIRASRIQLEGMITRVALAELKVEGLAKEIEHIQEKLDRT